MSHYYKKRKSRFTAQKLSLTAWLIIINISVYLFLKIYLLITTPSTLEEISNLPLLNYFILKPTSILQGKYLPSLLLHFITHIYLFHLLINMFVLYSLGRLSERIIGRKRYIWFYVFSVLFAGFFGNTELGVRIFGSPDIFMMGASGAIFAIAGLYMILLPNIRFMIIFLPFFSLKATAMIPLVLFGVWALTIIFNLPIGNVAHFGGFLVGVVYGLYLKNRYKRKALQLQRMFR